jgi:hypothetical protein
MWLVNIVHYGIRSTCNRYTKIPLDVPCLALTTQSEHLCFTLQMHHTGIQKPGK